MQETAIASIRPAPASTAATTAFLSAQRVRPYEAFSTFAPVKIRPPARTAAPTRNPEYGQYAAWLAARAASSSSSSRAAIGESLSGRWTVDGGKTTTDLI